MYQAPIITFYAGFPGDQMEPSLFDIRVTSAGVYNPLFPPSGTLYDGWCLDRNVQIPVNTSYTAAVYSSYELGVLAANVPTLSANVNLGHLDNINWLLNHYDGTNYNYGDVQGAIWQLMGSNPIASYLGGQNPATITALVDLALANDAYVPDAGETIGVVIDPFSGNTHYQPLIIETKAAKIGDFVWHDRNANGIQDSGEEGIAGATAKLVRDMDSNGSIGADEVLASTTTGAAGEYSFKGLTPGLSYQVMFTLPSSYNGVSPFQNDGNPASGANSDGLMSGVIVLAPGEYNRTIDAGFYQFASIGDRVWLDANANGRQDDGEAGVAGVTVRLLDVNGLVIGTTSTGAEGQYHFSGLVPSTYSVEFVRPDGFVFTQAGAAGAGDDRNSDANTLNGRTVATVLESGEDDLSWDAGLVAARPDPAKISGYVYEDFGNDGVRGPTEPVIGLITITLTGIDDLGNAVSRTAVTDINGYYEFADLRPGTYKLSETQPVNYLDGKDTAGTAGGVVSDDMIAGIPLSAGQHSQNNNFGELVGAYIRGTVFCDNNNDGTQQAGDVGLSGVMITLTGLDDRGQAVSAATTTDADGHYSFDGLRPGTYRVAEPDQPAGKLDGKDTAGLFGGGVAGNDVIDGIVLTQGLISENNNFGEIKPNSISGYVYCDGSDNGLREIGELGLPGVAVRLTGLDDRGLAVDVTVNTGPDGKYLFANLRPGTYAVSEPNQPADKIDGRDTAGSTPGSVATNDLISNIVLGTGQDSTDNNFGEIKPSSIAGFVYCDDNNDGIKQGTEQGLAGVQVRLTGSNDLNQPVDITLTTGADGSYKFDKLRPGVYTVTELSQPVGKDDGQETAGTAGGDTSVNEVISGIVLPPAFDSTGNNFGELLPPAAQVSGFVYCDDNNDGVKQGSEPGLAGVTVKLTGTNDLGAALSLSTTTGADGSYAFTGLRAGNYTVTETTQPSAKLDGRETAGSTGGNTSVNEVISNIVVATGQSSSGNNFGEILPAKLSGHVYEDIGNDGVRNSEPAIAGATVKLTGTNDLGQAVMLTTTTNAAGYYEFANLRPGSYKVIETQPAGYLDGKDTAGTKGGVVTNDMIANIPLVAGDHSQNNNFGEIRPASIGDRVWEDKNYNGIQDAGEVGVSGVTVKLLDSAGAVLAITTTNTTGNYLFSNLNPGDYKIQVVSPSGYFVTRKDLGGNDTLDSDIDASGTTVVTTLSAGGNDLKWDAGLYRKASVGDRVWEDSNENFIQDPGELGIAGISVKLLAADGRTVLATTTTNTNGNYLFSNLDPGSYVLQFDKAGVRFQGYKLDGWKWAVKDFGGNDSVDSDVAGDGVSKTNVTKTDLFMLMSGQNDMTRDAGITPIVIDLDGNGIRTLARSDDSSGFDLFGNGNLVKSGWISGSDGFLAVDRNGNGRIDDISELFGGNAKGAGFAQLASFDSNGDGVLNDLDEAFGQLMIWRDINGNRSTDGGELMTLAQAGVASLTLAYTELPFVDGQGNLHLERSNATLASGASVSMTDVYFNVSVDDALAAGVKLPTMAELLGEDHALDAVLGGAGMASTCQVRLADESVISGGDAGEALRKLAALTRDDSHHAAAA